MPESRSAFLVVDLEARAQVNALNQAFQSFERMSLAAQEDASTQRARMADKLDDLAKNLGKKLDDGLKDLDTKINRVHGFMYTILWTGACSLIVVLLTIVAFFVAPFFIIHLH
jgi:uncharacterized membrane protein YukC